MKRSLRIQNPQNPLYEPFRVAFKENHGVGFFAEFVEPVGELVGEAAGSGENADGFAFVDQVGELVEGGN